MWEKFASENFAPHALSETGRSETSLELSAGPGALGSLPHRNAAAAILRVGVFDVRRK